MNFKILAILVGAVVLVASAMPSHKNKRSPQVPPPPEFPQPPDFPLPLLNSGSARSVRHAQSEDDATPPSRIARHAQEEVPEPPTRFVRHAQEEVPEPPSRFVRHAQEGVPEPPSRFVRHAQDEVPEPPSRIAASEAKRFVRQSEDDVPQEPPSRIARQVSNSNEIIMEPRQKKLRREEFYTSITTLNRKKRGGTRG